MNSKQFSYIILLLALFTSSLMHSPHFRKDIMSFHSWRQTQTQATINNFYEEDSNILNPRRLARGAGDGIKRMEFPLMQWLIASSYHLFGQSVMVSRLFVFLLSLLGVLGMYRLLLALFSKPLLAAIGAWAFTFSPSFYFYSINPQPDLMALSATLWGAAFFFDWHRQQKAMQLWLAALFLAIGTLCKLPFGAYYLLPMVYFLKQWRNSIKPKNLEAAAVFLVFALFPLAWYLWVIPQWDDNPIIWGMLENQSAFSKLLYYLQFNLISTLPELLLNYGSVAFFLAGFYFMKKRKAFQNNRFDPLLGVSITVLAYYLFEANAIAQVHDYYLFPFLPLLFILVGYGAYHLLQQQAQFWRYFVGFALLILPLTCYLRMKDRWNPDSPGFNPDLLTYKKELATAVPAEALVISGYDVSSCIFLYYIDKKGWSFTDGHLSGAQLDERIAQGAEYLYIDEASYTERAEVQARLDTLVGEYGSIQIYRLKGKGNKLK